VAVDWHAVCSIRLLIISQQHGTGISICASRGLVEAFLCLSLVAPLLSLPVLNAFSSVGCTSDRHYLERVGRGKTSLAAANEGLGPGRESSSKAPLDSTRGSSSPHCGFIDNDPCTQQTPKFAASDSGKQHHVVLRASLRLSIDHSSPSAHSEPRKGYPDHTLSTRQRFPPCHETKH